MTNFANLPPEVQDEIRSLRMDNARLRDEVFALNQKLHAALVKGSLQRGEAR